MALIESYILPLNTTAPPFSLPNVVNGEMQTLEQLKGKKGTFVIFMCNHCPYVIHLLEGIIHMAKHFLDKEIAALAISSNNVVSHPQDHPEKMKVLALEKAFPFPYLYDASQEIAHNYQAACTPDFYLFDEDLLLVYRGRYDDSRPGNETPVSGIDLHEAADLMLQKKPQKELQYPSMGCSIKWLPGNSPEELN